MVKRYERLQEMAKVGIVNDLTIEVYTDHNPPHFHVTKKDKFEVRIDINTLEILSYKWQRSNAKLSSKDLDIIEKWLKMKYKNKNITNKDIIEIFWDSMN
jgi:hypothetical protein